MGQGEEEEEVIGMAIETEMETFMMVVTATFNASEVV